VFSIIGFLVALLLIVSVHEWGHFYTARRLGMPVVRFSIGMGGAVWSKRIGEVDYRLGWLPLGGYVMFADPKEHTIAPELITKTFNAQPLWARALVVFAGPFVNILLAWILMTFVLMVGVQAPKAWLAAGQVGTPWAEVSGDSIAQVIAINDVVIDQFEQLPVQLLRQISQSETLHFSLQNWEGGVREVTVPVASWRALAWSNPTDQLALWGVAPAMPPLPAVIAQVDINSAAEKAGLLVNDEIKQLNGMQVEGFADLSQWIKEHPNSTVELIVERGGHLLTLNATIAIRTLADGKQQGFLGIRPQLPADWQEKLLSVSGMSFLSALTTAPVKLWDMTVLTWQAIGRLLTGQSGMEQLSGPIGIAQAAGSSLEMGSIRFIQFLALLSLSLGVLNLLPLPLLDGGHLLLYGLEWVRGRALSESVMLVWQKVGIVLIAALTLLAIGSDLNRLFGG
jgi:regulator of sigma E protease